MYIMRDINLEDADCRFLLEVTLPSVQLNEKKGKRSRLI